MNQAFCNLLNHVILLTEEAYDHVIRRWGNIKFAQSTVYDWLWSEEFEELCQPLNDMEKGQLRMLVMRRFGVKPWPWFSSKSTHHFY